MPDRETSYGNARCETTLLSVVLCTRGRPGSLQRCITSLRAVGDPHFEVVIVDNHRVPKVEAVDNERIRVVHERRKGLDFARNRGIAEARGDVIVFVDDDCEVDPSWLTAIRAAFADDAVACVTGRVVAARLERPSQRMFERLVSFDRGTERRRFSVPKGELISPSKASELGTGCNMAFRKEIFERVGQFDEALDMGTPVGGGGDLDMFARVLAEGEQTVYEPSAIVRHHHRSTLRELAWQLFGYGVSASALTVKNVRDGENSLRAALRSQWEFIRFMLAGVKRCPRGGRTFGLAFVLVVLVGDVCGPLAYLLARVTTRRASTA